MATKKTAAQPTRFAGVDALKHADDKRRNIPTAEYQSLMADEARKPVQVTYPRGTANADHLKAEKEARNRDMDPQLVWHGKDAQDWTDLVVNAPPLYIQEKMHPKVLIDELKNTGAGNLLVVFGEPDIRIEPVVGGSADGQVRVRVKGVDVFRPQTGEIESGGTDSIALWMIDTEYKEESFFVRQAYFLGASDPYKALKTTLKAEIDAEAWATLNSDVSRPFEKPRTGRIAVKVINHLGDEVMKVFGVG